MSNEIGHITSKREEEKELITQLNDRLDIITEMFSKSKTTTNIPFLENANDGKSYHPLKGKTNLSFRTSFLNLGHITDPSNIPNF